MSLVVYSSPEQQYFWTDKIVLFNRQYKNFNQHGEK